MRSLLANSRKEGHTPDVQDWGEALDTSREAGPPGGLIDYHRSQWAPPALFPDPSFCFLFFKKKLCVCFWLRRVFIIVLGLSLAVTSRGYALLWRVGPSLPWLLLLRSMGASLVEAPGL